MNRAEVPTFSPDVDPEDWKEKVRELADLVVGSLGEVGEPRTAIAPKVIRAFRDALGEMSLDELIDAQPESVQEEIGGGPMDESSFPVMIRYELQTLGKRWDTPIGAESVMSVVQHWLGFLLAGPVPAYWEGRLDGAARLVARREFDAASPAELDVIVDRVMTFGREAMGDAPDSALIQSTTTWDDGPVVSTRFLSMAGLFRHVIRSLDHRNPDVAAAALRVIEASARDEVRRLAIGELESSDE